VEIVEAELTGRLVAQLDESDQVRRDRRTDLLACQPGLFPLGEIGLVFEDVFDLVVRHLLAVDGAPEGAEVLLDLGAQLDDLLEPLRLDLLEYACRAPSAPGQKRVWTARLPGFEKCELLRSL
jgi:hypothetical protein